MALAQKVWLCGCAAVAVAALAMAVGGCGNSRTPVPSATRPSAPRGFRTLTLSRAGVSLAVPRSWTSVGQRAPLVATVVSGAAVVALWRFARHTPLQGRGALERARASLLAAVRRRDRTLRVQSTSLTRVDGAPALVLTALEQINGQLRRVSSLHVYARGDELVLDEYAPPAQFATVDRTVFLPLRRSLVLLGSAG